MNKVKIGQNQYCVPAVISILTGKDTDECARMISRVTGQSQVTMVRYEDAITVLTKLGMEITLVPNASECSLFTTMHFIAREDGMYLVGVPAHVVAVEVKDHRVFLCDNHTKEPINGASSARLGQRVDRVYRVSIPPLPTILDVKITAHEISRYYEISTIWSDMTEEKKSLIIRCIE